MTDGGWRGVTMPGQVIYEMHIGAFTKAGTYKYACLVHPQMVAELHVQ